MLTMLWQCNTCPEGVGSFTISPGPPWLVSHSTAATALHVGMRHPFKVSEFWRENTNRGTQLQDSQLTTSFCAVQRRPEPSVVTEVGVSCHPGLPQTCYVVEEDLKFLILLPHLLNAVATDMHSTSGLHSARNRTQGFVRIGQALYQWHHIPRSGCLDLRFCFFSPCFLLCKPGRIFHIFLGVHVHTQRAIH